MNLHRNTLVEIKYNGSGIYLLIRNGLLKGSPEFHGNSPQFGVKMA